MKKIPTLFILGHLQSNKNSETFILVNENKKKHDFGCFIILKCLSGDRSFWDITGQQRWNWKRSVCGGPNPGDSWCICMWATANIVAEVGCDNVQINCSATDVDYVLR